ncbi:MAG: ATP-binding cassette domain-containing protein [Bryobacterales bacterium]
MEAPARRRLRLAGRDRRLLGANGSSKTTFLLHLLGLLHGEGEIEVCGKRLEKSARSHARQKIGVLFRDSDDQLFMPTVEEDVAFGRAISNCPKRKSNAASSPR